jgi:NH3-dependent NAD+ synthetase
MIDLEDCIALCGLTKKEVLALAEHEHVPERIRDMIVDDVQAAQARGDRAHVLMLLHVLHHFLRTHPNVLPPWHNENQGSRDQA